MQHSCELQTPDDPFVWPTIALSASGIPLCGYFLSESWKTWNRMRLSVPSSQASRRSPESSSQLAGSEAEAAAPQRTVSAASKATTVQSFGLLRSPITIRAAANLFQHNHLPAGSSIFQRECTSPVQWIFQLTLNETLQLLLLSSWILMTIDQFLDTSYVSTIMLLCPHFNCKRQALADMPGCPATTLNTIQLYIQPLASCLFVLATMNRFVRVYAFLSRPRQLALQIGSGMIILAPALRWMAVPLLEKLVYLPTGLYEEETSNQRALLLYNLSFHGVYLVLSLADIVSLLLGLHYVLQIRSELKGLRKQEGGGLQVHSTVPQLVQASSSLFAAPGSIATTAPAHLQQNKWVQRQEQSAAVALFWIIFNLALLAAYLSIMMVPEILVNLPVQFVFALLTMILKLFVTGMTFSINAMTRLVKARNRTQNP